MNRMHQEWRASIRNNNQDALDSGKMNQQSIHKQLLSSIAGAEQTKQCDPHRLQDPGRSQLMNENIPDAVTI